MKKTIVIALILVIGLIGAQFAYTINSYNPLLPRGFLGLLMIYLIFQYGLLPLKKEPVDILLVFPRNIKYFFYMFIGTVV